MFWTEHPSARSARIVPLALGEGLGPEDFVIACSGCADAFYTARLSAPARPAPATPLYGPATRRLLAAHPHL